MLKSLLIVCMVLLSGFAATATGQSKVDSLEILLSKDSEDTTIFDHSYDIAINFVKSNPDSCLKYINYGFQHINPQDNIDRYFKGLNLKAAAHWFNSHLDSSIAVYYEGLKLSNQHDNADMTAKFSNNIGVTYQYIGNIDSAEKYLSAACQIYDSTGNKKAYAKASLDLGGLYTAESRYDLAIEKLLEGLNTFEEIDDTLYLIHGYNGIGNLYLNIDDTEEALKYYRKSLNLIKHFDKGDISDELYCNIGLAYFQGAGNNDSAEYYFKKTLSKKNIENNHLLYSTALVNLATLKNNEREFDEALQYFNIVKNMEITKSDPYSKMVCYVNLGSTYLEMGQLEDAKKHLNIGLEQALKLNNLEFQKNAYLYLSRVDSIKGNLLSSLNYYQKYNKISLTIHDTEVEEKIHVINSKHQLKQMQTENKLLGEQNALKQDLIAKHIKLNILTVIVLILTLGILVFTLFMYRKTKKLNSKLKEQNYEISKQKEELQTLNNQLNKLISIIAHDLKAPFNALIGLLNELDINGSQYSEEEKVAIIKGLLKNTRSTYNLLENLMEWSVSKTGLLRMNIEKVNLAKLVEEVLQLNRIQIENKLLIIENTLSPHTEVYADHKMSFTILTNLINNAIKFNHQGGIIRIKSELFDDFVRISIIDNGIGIPEKYIDSIFSIDSEYQTRGTENEYGTGLGLKVVAEFIGRMHGKVSVKSNKGQGAAFSFELPINNPEE